jgi:hypothetical protein
MTDNKSSKDPEVVVVDEASNQLIPTGAGVAKADQSYKDALKTYLQQVSKYELLSAEEEKELTLHLFETGT